MSFNFNFQSFSNQWDQLKENASKYPPFTWSRTREPPKPKPPLFSIARFHQSPRSFKYLFAATAGVFATGVGALWLYNSNWFSFQGILDHPGIGIDEYTENNHSLFQNPRVILTHDFGHGTDLGSVEYHIHAAENELHGKMIARVDEIISFSDTIASNFISYSRRPLTLKVVNTEGNCILILRRPWYWLRSRMEVYDGKFKYLGYVQRRFTISGAKYDLYVDKKLITQDIVDSFRAATNLTKAQRERDASTSKQFELTSFEDSSSSNKKQQKAIQPHLNLPSSSPSMVRFGRFSIWPLTRTHSIYSKKFQPSPFVSFSESSWNRIFSETNPTIDPLSLDFTISQPANRFKGKNKTLAKIKNVLSIRDVIVQRRKHYCVQFGNESITSRNLGDTWSDSDSQISEEQQETTSQSVIDNILNELDQEYEDESIPESLTPIVDSQGDSDLEPISNILAQAPSSITHLIPTQTTQHDALKSKFYDHVDDTHQLTVPERAVVFSAAILRDLDIFFGDLEEQLESEKAIALEQVKVAKATAIESPE